MTYKIIHPENTDMTLVDIEKSTTFYELIGYADCQLKMERKGRRMEIAEIITKDFRLVKCAENEQGWLYEMKKTQDLGIKRLW